jgi:hypothetical protein
MRLTQNEATELLGLAGALVTKEVVDLAFTGKVKLDHPDNGGPGHGITKLKEARDILRQVVAGANNRCKTCSGAGIVRGKVGAVTCAACKGTGDRRQ